jgi:phage recombination protein Bet
MVEVSSDFAKLITGKRVTYIPQGESDPIELSPEMVKRFLVRPTKSGKMPSESDVLKFVMLCKARELNPWVGDAYLVGYDGKDGPEFSLITSVHALHKRADRCPEYDGMHAGVIVKVGKEQHEIEGTCYPDGATLIGSWARAFRKDRKEAYYVSLRLGTYNKGRSLWQTDAAGMIRKCAVAAVLREAFPNQTSGMYLREEFERPPVETAPPRERPKSINDILHRLSPETEPAPQPDDDPTAARIESHGADETRPEPDGELTDAEKAEALAAEAAEAEQTKPSGRRQKEMLP